MNHILSSVTQWLKISTSQAFDNNQLKFPDKNYKSNMVVLGIDFLVILDADSKYLVIFEISFHRKPPPVRTTNYSEFAAQRTLRSLLHDSLFKFLYNFI